MDRHRIHGTIKNALVGGPKIRLKEVIRKKCKKGVFRGALEVSAVYVKFYCH